MPLRADPDRHRVSTDGTWQGPEGSLRPDATPGRPARGRSRAPTGGIGPRQAWDQRGAVAGAIAPANARVDGGTSSDAPCPDPSRRAQSKETPLRAGETHCVSPARARRCHQDRCNPHQQRPALDPAGEKRPPGAGRALAGGFGPPAGQGSAWRCGRGDGPCHGNDAVPPPLRAGTGNALRVPARARRFPVDRQVQAPRRPAPAGGWGGRWLRVLAPGWPGINVAPWQGRWPLPGCAGGSVSRVPVRQPLRGALFRTRLKQHPPRRIWRAGRLRSDDLSPAPAPLRSAGSTAG